LAKTGVSIPYFPQSLIMKDARLMIPAVAVQNQLEAFSGRNSLLLTAVPQRQASPDVLRDAFCRNHGRGGVL
jgi:hypothetical protein